MKGRYYTCTVCGEQYDGRPAVEFEINPDARAVGGGVVWSGESPVNWPRDELAIHLCPQHASKVMEDMNQMFEVNDGR